MGSTKDSNQDHQHEKLGDTLAMNNAFYEKDEHRPHSLSHDNDNKTDFADEKNDVKGKAKVQLNKMERPMAETLKELNSVTPVLTKGAAGKPTPDVSEGAKKDVYADSQALHDEQAAKLLHSHKPMNETLAEANQFVGDAKESA